MSYNNFTARKKTTSKEPYRKYNNKPQVVDGIKFDSIVEADYYNYLKTQLERKRIKMFKPNVTFPILDGYQLEEFEIEGHPIKRRKASEIKYIADFVVTYNNGMVAVIDTKGGATTEAFKIKKKMFELRWKVPIVEVRKKDGGGWDYS